MLSKPIALLFALIASNVSVGRVFADEIVMLSTPTMELAFRDLLPTFEKQTGHVVRVEYGLVPLLIRRLAEGKADVFVAGGQQVPEREKNGTIASGTSAKLGEVHIAAFSREGAAKVNIATVDGL